ncbi:hypothetical protein HCZ95_06490 [Limosilactobacillus fermentum]
MSQPSNEQIAHDLAVAYVADGWRAGEISERLSAQAYLQAYKRFLSDLNRLNR